MSKTIKFSELVNPTERQLSFWDAVDTYKFVLYGGAAGGGKSYILRWTLIRLLLKWFSKGKTGVRVGLFCEDYPSLRERHISKIHYEFPDWLGKYRDQTHEFTLAPSLGAGVICFRNLDDPSKYLSSEFAAIAVDELTRNEQGVFDFLRMRMRWPGIDDTKFMAATNPGGPGHGWVRKLWVDRDFPAELKKIENEFYFVPAKATDNPHLPQSYVDDLNTLPERLRKAYAEGSWDVFEGQYFTEFNRDKHVIDPFPIPDYWKRFRSIDWGYNDPCAVLWHCVAPDSRIYTYRELYITQTTASEVVKKILELSAGEQIDYTVSSPDMWQKRGNDHIHGESIAETFAKHGVPLIKADNDRINGWQRMHEYLADAPDGKPYWQIFSNCHNLIRTLPALVHDEHRVEDVSDKCEDHAPESARYALMSRPSPKIIVPEKKQLPWMFRSREPEESEGIIDW